MIFGIHQPHTNPHTRTRIDLTGLGIFYSESADLFYDELQRIPMDSER